MMGIIITEKFSVHNIGFEIKSLTILFERSGKGMCVEAELDKQ